MTHSAFAATNPAGAAGPTSGTEYRPGVCNIGPAEIARRRRTGHVGLVGTLVVLVAEVGIGLPPAARLAVVIPAAISAGGYLQAWLRFCAAYGWLGVFNFGRAGRTLPVADPAARRRDLMKAAQIGLASLVIGVVVAVAAVLLPL